MNKTTNREKKDAELISNTLGYMLSIFTLLPLLLFWYNHVWLQHSIAYWQYVIIGALVAFFGHVYEKWLGYILGFVLIATVFLQVLSWIKLIVLPIFKLSH